MKRLAVAAMAVIALAGCTVPSQSLAPGVALVHDGVVVTNADVDAMVSALRFGDNAQQLANRSQLLTLEVMHDAVVAKVAELSDGQMIINTALATVYADKWLALQGDTEPATPELVRVFETVIAISLINGVDVDGSILRDLGEQVRAQLTPGVRTREFSTQALMDSLATATNDAYRITQTGTDAEAELAWVTYAHVDAFVAPESGIRTTPDAA